MRHSWLVPLVLLSAVAGGGALILWQPPWLAGVVVSAILGAGFLWLAVSIFWPAKADRRCPACGEDALIRLDPDSTKGLRCRACDHEDPEASSWFLAEEEGPLEDLVLRQRSRSVHTGGR